MFCCAIFLEVMRFKIDSKRDRCDDAIASPFLRVIRLKNHAVKLVLYMDFC